jgi:hypothetical protein
MQSEFSLSASALSLQCYPERKLRDDAGSSEKMRRLVFDGSPVFFRWWVGTWARDVALSLGGLLFQLIEVACEWSHLSPAV